MINLIDIKYQWFWVDDQRHGHLFFCRLVLMCSVLKTCPLYSSNHVAMQNNKQAAHTGLASTQTQTATVQSKTLKRKQKQKNASSRKADVRTWTAARGANQDSPLPPTTQSQQAPCDPTYKHATDIQRWWHFGCHNHKQAVKPNIPNFHRSSPDQKPARRLQIVNSLPDFKSFPSDLGPMFLWLSDDLNFSDGDGLNWINFLNQKIHPRPRNQQHTIPPNSEQSQQ